jgi:hypothetical protein
MASSPEQSLTAGPALVAADRYLSGTRSSHRWGEVPGGFDRLNCRALFPTDNRWGIPALPSASLEPARLVSYTDRHAIAKADTGTALHFFLDDYRFEAVWTTPGRALSRPRAVGAALTPDFSLWRDMPTVMQLWQVYRSRWCGAWMAAHGVTVIPTVSWAGPDSYPFAFAGITRGSVVAVSTVGVHREHEARTLFAAGYTAMLDAVDPPMVLVYGKPLHGHTGGPRQRCYPTRWDGR